jgi:hypothetical protein
MCKVFRNIYYYGEEHGNVTRAEDKVMTRLKCCNFTFLFPSLFIGDEIGIKRPISRRLVPSYAQILPLLSSILLVYALPVWKPQLPTTSVREYYATGYSTGSGVK